MGAVPQSWRESVIERIRHVSNFVQIGKSLTEREDMSLAAKGLMAYLLSKPDDWQFTFDNIVSHCGTDGKRSVRTAVNELKEHGYLEIRAVHRGGRLAGKEWLVYEEPTDLSVDHVSCRTENVSDTKRVGHESCGTQNVADITNTQVTNTQSTNTQETKKVSAFAPPTVEQVAEYATGKGLSIDAGAFVDFYASKGWMVGRNKMRDWKAAVRNWCRRDATRGGAKGGVSRDHSEYDRAFR